MLKGKLRNILDIRDAPHKIALSFAVGLFVAISPFIGAHTLMALALAWALRLNRVVTFTAVYVTNPWSMIPIYTFCTWIGMVVLGVDIVPSEINWRNIRLSTIQLEFGDIIPPFLVGTLVVATAASFLSYFLVRKMVERTRGGSVVPVDKGITLKQEGNGRS